MSPMRFLSQVAAAAVVSFTAVAQAPVPAGWKVSGSEAAAYTAGVAPQGGQRKNPAAFIRSGTSRGFGALMQTIQARDYRGKRIRFAASLRSEDAGRVALLLRVNGEGATVLSFDNMSRKPVKGTTKWAPYEIVADIPGEARVIAFGLLLEGNGVAWIDRARLEVVSTLGPVAPSEDYPATLPRAPENLDFSR
jgi:hypothetical protein